MDYKNIMVAVDNSDYSTHGVDLGIEIARTYEGSLTGVHVFAAKLHDWRFRQMEGGLPERYRFEGELEKQREIHDSLITKGLEIITDSYLDAAEGRCRDAGMPGSPWSASHWKGRTIRPLWRISGAMPRTC